MREERLAMIVGRHPGEGEEDESFETYDDYCYSEHVIGQPRVWVSELPELPSVQIAVHDRADSQLSERLAAAVRALPDPRLVKRVTVLAKAHRDERWLRRLLSRPELTVDAETTPLGEIILYGSAHGADLEHHLLHEWHYLLKKVSPRESAAFDAIGDLEPFELIENRPLEAYRGDETWSPFGEYLTAPDREPGEPLIAAAAKPLHASLWGKAFAARVDSLPPELQGPHHEFFARLGRFIDGVVRPQALAALEDCDPDRASQVRAILEVLRT